MASDYFGEKESFDVSKDPLKLLYNVTFQLIQFKFIKNVLIFTFILHLVINSVHVIHIMNTFDADLLIKYASTLFPIVYGSATIIFDMIHETKTTIIMKETFAQMWTLNSTDPETFKRIQKESKILTTLVIIDATLAVVTIIFYLPIMEQDCDIYYAIMLFNTTFSSRISLVLSILYYITIPVLFFAMLCTTFALFYIMVYEKFQTYMINDLLKNISSDYDNIDDWKMVRNSTYQERIHERLTICIQRHQLLKRMANGINNIIYTPIVVLVCLGFTLYMSLGYNFIVLGVGEKDDYIRSSVSIISAMFNGILFFYYGQSLIDESEKITENIFNCPWTLWNVKNRKNLVFFMMNTQKPLILGNETMFICGYVFIVKALKFMGSTLMFFQEITSQLAESDRNSMSLT